MQTLPPPEAEVEVVLHPCPHCGQPTDPRRIRCAHCRRRLVPLTLAQRATAWLALVMTVGIVLAVGAVVLASCATALVVALIVVPLLAGAYALLKGRR